MNIVIDVREALLERVGVSVYSRNLIPQLLVLAGDAVRFILIGPSGSVCPFQLGGNASYLAIAPPADASYFTKLSWYYRLPRLLHRLDADVYFGNFTRLPLARRLPCPLVVTAHDAASLTTEKLVGGRIARTRNYRFVKGWVDCASQIICVSEYCRSEFAAIFGPAFNEKSVVIHHGLPEEFKRAACDISAADTESARRRYGLTKKYLFSLGTVTPKKNYARLVESFASLQRPELQLAIAGKLSYGAEEVTAAVDRFGMTGRVMFLGQVDTQEMTALMKGAECFIFPSVYEGFGLPLLEAFELGVPVACSRATCLPEIAGSAALFFDPYDVREMAGRMAEVLDNTELRRTLAERGMERVKTYTWRASAESHLRVLKRVAIS